MLIRQLNAIGLACSRMRNGIPEVRTPGREELVNLVVAAQGKVDGAEEITALKNYLGAESNEWAAYVEARKAPIRVQRAIRYKDETDPMRLKMDEDYTPGSTEWNAALEEWKTAKDLIRADLIYPVEL